MSVKDAKCTKSTNTIAEIFTALTADTLPFRMTAYDGSSLGPENSPYTIHVKSQRALNYLLTAPGDLGVIRAYLQGDLELHGTPPGDPYVAFSALPKGISFRKPSLLTMLGILRSLGISSLALPPIPALEKTPRWKRVCEGLRHSKKRDAKVIQHHYDVSNTFYEYLLGSSMAYTCAVYPTQDTALSVAQENKFRLVFEKLALKPGDRLLDVGCGWGSMVRYAAKRGVSAIGVTLSEQQACWAQQAIADQGLSELAQVRFCDYRDVPEKDFDAISSIGLTEHVGVKNYPRYFSFLRSKLKEGGYLLNHCITRANNQRNPRAGAFIDRYIFPDGELTGSGKIITDIQNIGGFEVIHSENLREHYALTLRDWNANLVAHWDAVVREVGEELAKLWGLYLAGCRLGFDANVTQLHQVLAVKLRSDNRPSYPLRPWWNP